MPGVHRGPTPRTTQEVPLPGLHRPLGHAVGFRAPRYCHTDLRAALLQLVGEIAAVLTTAVDAKETKRPPQERIGIVARPRVEREVVLERRLGTLVRHRRAVGARLKWKGAYCIKIDEEAIAAVLE